MIFGLNTEVYKNLKEQQILHIRNTDNYYFLNDKENQQTSLLKTNILNSISISVVLGIFFEYEIWVYAAVAVAVYVGYLLFYNLKILPVLNRAKGKDCTRQPKKDSRDNRQLIWSGICFLAIGAGLVYCLMTGQAEGQMLKPVTIIGMVVSLFFGLRMILQANSIA